LARFKIAVSHLTSERSCCYRNLKPAHRSLTSLSFTAIKSFNAEAAEFLLVLGLPA